MRNIIGDLNKWNKVYQVHELEDSIFKYVNYLQIDLYMQYYPNQNSRKFFLVQLVTFDIKMQKSLFKSLWCIDFDKSIDVNSIRNKCWTLFALFGCLFSETKEIVQVSTIYMGFVFSSSPLLISSSFFTCST